MKSTWPHVGRYLAVPVVLFMRAYAFPGPPYPSQPALSSQSPSVLSGIWTGTIPDTKGKPLLARLMFTGAGRVMAQFTSKKGETFQVEGCYHRAENQIMASWSDKQRHLPPNSPWSTGFYGQKQGESLLLSAPPSHSSCRFSPSFQPLLAKASAE